ncbi:hypothetical protein [Roseinatronobacter sp. S2]|nr:hypothetical protein [Roseinatronobacter sp. S2]WFE75018.1 hypothetical protein P8S53_01040 [Roseinatronobacter sp. S2]
MALTAIILYYVEQMHPARKIRRKARSEHIRDAQNRVPLLRNIR